MSVVLLSLEWWNDAMACLIFINIWYVQGHSQNLKEVPQNFTEVFKIDDVTTNDVMQRNQHCKETK